jgi:hypothetical protein
MAKDTKGMGYGEGQWKDTSRQTVGNSIYHDKVDAPSASEFRAGSLTHKEGYDKQGDANMGSAGGRTHEKQGMGARYNPQITHRPGFVENASTLAAGRIVSSAAGSWSNFNAH